MEKPLPGQETQSLGLSLTAGWVCPLQMPPDGAANAAASSPTEWNSQWKNGLPDAAKPKKNSGSARRKEKRTHFNLAGGGEKSASSRRGPGPEGGCPLGGNRDRRSQACGAARRPMGVGSMPRRKQPTRHVATGEGMVGLWQLVTKIWPWPESRAQGACRGEDPRGEHGGPSVASPSCGSPRRCAACPVCKTMHLLAWSPPDWQEITPIGNKSHMGCKTCQDIAHSSQCLCRVM